MRAVLSKIEVSSTGTTMVVNNDIEIKDYKDYYKYCEYSCFDVVMVNWDGISVSVYVDDEGLMKDGNFGRDVQGYSQPLFGNLIITGGVDDEGDTLPLPNEFNPQNITNYISDVKYIVGA